MPAVSVELVNLQLAVAAAPNTCLLLEYTQLHRPMCQGIAFQACCCSKLWLTSPDGKCLLRQSGKSP